MYYIVLYYIILFYVMLCYFVLYCILLYYIIFVQIRWTFIIIYLIFWYLLQRRVKIAPAFCYVLEATFAPRRQHWRHLFCIAGVAYRWMSLGKFQSQPALWEDGRWGSDVNGHRSILDVLDALQECDVECNFELHHSSYGDAGDVATNQKFWLYDIWAP